MFYAQDRYPKMQVGDDAIPFKDIILFHRSEEGKRNVVICFDTVTITAQAAFSVSVADHSKENRMHAEMLALFLNSKECTKKLRKAFLDSIDNRYEKGKMSMFRVIFPPFDESLKLGENVKASLVYGSHRRIRVLCSNISSDNSLTWRMETVAGCLNDSRSFEFTKGMLRSIEDTWRMGDSIRNGTFHPKRPNEQRQAPFAPNNYYGQGGSGFDGVW